MAFAISACDKSVKGHFLNQMPPHWSIMDKVWSYLILIVSLYKIAKIIYHNWLEIDYNDNNFLGIEIPI